jgi:hypothetical protein
MNWFKVVLFIIVHNFLILDPPQSAPVITTMSTEPLAPGSKLACSVPDGDPANTSINFQCFSPHHTGQVSTVASTGNKTVSVLTLNYTDDDDGSMLCTCSAIWEPKPAAYMNNSDTKNFEIDCKTSTINPFTAEVANMRLLGSAPKSHLCDQRRRSKVTGLSDLMTLFIDLGCLYCKQTERAFNVFTNTLN